MAFYRCRGADRRDDADQPICDHEAEQAWRGRCPKCRQPYGFVRVGAERARKGAATATLATEVKEIVRYPTGVEHFDGVIGGGAVLGKVCLLGGTRGAGKSTLLLNLCDEFARRDRPALYASAEESQETVIQMARRAGAGKNSNVGVMGHASNLDDIFARCREVKPALLVIDSLQAIEEGAHIEGGRTERSVQVVKAIEPFCRKRDIFVIVINHMTKSNEFVGSTLVEHDITGALMMFMNYNAADDGELRMCMSRDEARAVRPENVRVLLGVGKNRIGPANEKRFFEMTNLGRLRQIPVKPRLVSLGDEAESEA